MSSVILKSSEQEYLQKCLQEYKFAFGIIIGQKLEKQKFAIVHLARNCEEDADSNSILQEVNQNIANIDTHILVDQCANALKMISGSFSVLGAFICCENQLEEKLMKPMAKKICSAQWFNKALYNDGESEECPSNLFLLYSATIKKPICMIYSKSENSFTRANCLIEEPEFEWFVFESSYELDEIFPITSTVQKINLENQLEKILIAVRRNLISSEIFIQNENVEKSLSLETYIKQKYGKMEKTELTFKASIYLPTNKASQVETVEVKLYNGTIRLSGTISSRVWCRPENTIEEIKHFIRVDIIRSLAARIQVYCDGLTEPNVNFDTVVINEPPRRVYFAPPKERIQFSEYIFRGETPTVAVAQAKQVLDIEIDSTCIYDDLEVPPDDEAFTLNSSDTQIRISTATSLQLQITRSMYLLGTVVALFVLIVSILLHFTMG